MPTSKRRIGFIPRGEVLNIINKLSSESNLSNSKVINILVEEALLKRGLINFNSSNFINIEKDDVNYEKFNNDYIDPVIYQKFLMFLKFQERMRSQN